MKILDAVPSEARSLFRDGVYLKSESAVAAQVAALIVTDSRMLGPWLALARHADSEYRDESGGWAESFVVTVASQYIAAVGDRRRWDSMTLAEQKRWRRQFVIAVLRLEALIDSGPLPGGLAGELMYRSDVDERDRRRRLAPSDRPVFDDWLDDPFAFGIPASNLSPQILNALIEYQLDAAEERRQTLKKPRDKHGGRVRFIHQITGWCQAVCRTPMREVVATTGEVVFADPNIDARLVRLHTKR